MAFSEVLAMRVRDALGGGEQISEKRMMGGICFLLNGNMVCGVDKTRTGADRFMFRIGKGNAAVSKLPGGVVVTMGERSMPGFYFVDEAGCTEKNFKAWLVAAKAYVESLPPK